MLSSLLGPFLVALAAMLWATDALFRLPAVNQLDPTFIVFVEHAIALLVLTPYIFIRQRGNLWRLSAVQWLAAILIGVGGSAAATVFFTASFRYINPSVAILLQKSQPIAVVILSFLFLKERPRGMFFVWALVAILAGVVLSFPDLNFSFLSNDLDLRSKGVTYALSAAGLWALSTVAGKALLLGTPPSVATFWRYVFGFFGLGLILLLGLGISGASPSFSTLSEMPILKSIAYMALVPGLLAMVFYYAGLQKTAASVATFAELVFPVSAVLLNTYFLKLPLVPMQIVAGSVLIFAVTMISLQQSQRR